MSKLLIVLIFFVLSGCGYTTRGVVCEYDKVMIEPVVNKINITSEHRGQSGYVNFPILIENKLTNELVNKFNIDGQLKVVSYEFDAFRLTCTVNNYRKETLRYEDNDDVKEQRLQLCVCMKLTNPKGETVKEKNVVGETTYFLNQKSETSAQVDLVDDTARRILEAVVEEW